MYISKINEKQEREMLRKVAPRMTGYGAQDQQMIIDYCEENGVSLPVYFSSIDWALKLGDGWFIPGNYELELFASSISSGLGVRMSEKERTPQPFALLHPPSPFGKNLTIIKEKRLNLCPWEERLILTRRTIIMFLNTVTGAIFSSGTIWHGVIL